MRDRYWYMYSKILDSKYYYWHYRIRSCNIQRYIKALLCIASCASIASWFIWSQLQIVWAIIVASSQAISAIQHLFPYSKQITTINFLLPDLDKLLIRIKHDWDFIDDFSAEEIGDRVQQYELEYNSLENHYLTDTEFPRKKKCIQKANKDRVNYFYEQYGIEELQQKQEVIKC